MACASEPNWDLDLDLDLDFDFQDARLSPLLDSSDILSLQDPLKDLESVSSSEPVLKLSAAALPPAAMGPLFQNVPLPPDQQPHSQPLSSISEPCAEQEPASADAQGKRPKRSRKPQKDRVAEVEQRIASLQQELRAGQLEQERLLLQQAQLESSTARAQSQESRPEQDRASTPGLPDRSALFYLLDTEGRMQQMTGRDIVNLPNEDAVAIHQIYMDRMRDMLAKRKDGSRDEEIVTLAGQVCMATYLKGVYKPDSMRELLSRNPLGLSMEDRKQVWSRVLAALKLTPAQREKLLHFRRLFTPTQRQLLQTRQELMASLRDTQTRPCPSDADLMKQTGACRRLLRQLQQNLHADQSILNRLFAQVFGEVLQGIQKAVILVEFWRHVKAAALLCYRMRLEIEGDRRPCPFDLVGLLTQLAEETEDTATEVVLGASSGSTSS